MLEGDEFFVFVVSAVAATAGFVRHMFPRMPALYFRRTFGLGLARAAVALAAGWITYVLWNHADPSVTGIYRLFYLVMGVAVVLWFGPVLSAAAGARFRIDVVERHNPRAALILAVALLATGLIFGGSIWGEADPVGDDEGGWWIPLGFFLFGWACLIIATILYLFRDGGAAYDKAHRERQWKTALPPAFYMLSTSTILAEAVSGDFYGWGHGLTAVGAIGGMLITRVLIAPLTARAGPAFESALYIVWGAAFWFISGMFQ